MRHVLSYVSCSYSLTLPSAKNASRLASRSPSHCQIPTTDSIHRRLSPQPSLPSAPPQTPPISETVSFPPGGQGVSLVISFTLPPIAFRSTCNVAATFCRCTNMGRTDDSTTRQQQSGRRVLWRVLPHGLEATQTRRYSGSTLSHHYSNLALVFLCSSRATEREHTYCILYPSVLWLDCSAKPTALTENLSSPSPSTARTLLLV